jgi:rhomboid protease GluP
MSSPLPSTSFPQRLPLTEQLAQRVAHVPVTYVLLAANILVFVVMLGYGAGIWHTSNNVQLDWGANFGPATKDGEWWRLGSALFLHFGLLHLAMNMLSLWDGGRLVERMYGPGRFVLIYFCSGLSGNLLSLIAQGDRAVSGGASGAIFGVYGALMVFLLRERRRLNSSEFKWLFWGAVGFSAVTIGLGLQITGIDNAAHIGGLLAGILSGAALSRPFGARNGARTSFWRSRWFAAGILASSLAYLITHIPEPRYRWSEELLARDEISEFIGADTRISARWGAILNRAREENATFDDLAGRIEHEVSSPYAQSFEQLSKLRLGPAAPSAATLETLREYASRRRDASRALVEGLRAKDPKQIRDALEMATKAPHQSKPPPTQSGEGATPR